MSEGRGIRSPRKRRPESAVVLLFPERNERALGARQGRKRPLLWDHRPKTATLFLWFCALSAPVVAVSPTVLAGDPAIYLSRISEVFAGRLPYLQAPFEHLPLAAAPMVLAWLLGGWLGPSIYTVAFAALMAACLWTTAMLVDRIGEHLDVPNAGFRWLLIAGPLFPLVLFRSDPWPVLLATAALAALVAGRERAALFWGVMGVMAKGWPIVLTAIEWARGKKKRSLVLTLTSAAILALLFLLPGFRSGRVFTGIHTDTTVGATLALVRALQGEPIGRFDAAGAIYLEAPPWALLVNANLGLVLGALALVALRLPMSWTASAKLTGALVIALLVGSPLLSPQFLLWPTPFLALHPSRTVRYLSSAVVLLTLVFMLGWNPVYQGSLWWLPVVSLRNGLLVVLGAMVAWSTGYRERVGIRAA